MIWTVCVFCRKRIFFRLVDAGGWKRVSGVNFFFFFGNGFFRNGSLTMFVVVERGKGEVVFWENRKPFDLVVVWFLG